MIVIIDTSFFCAALNHKQMSNCIFYHPPSENCDLFLVITKVGLVESYNLSWILAKFSHVTRYLSSFMAVFGVSLSLMTKMRNYFIARF